MFLEDAQMEPFQYQRHKEMAKETDSKNVLVHMKPDILILIK